MVATLFDTTGSRLAYLRNKKGDSQAELALKTDTTRANVANYENNKASPPPDFVAKAAVYFGCTEAFITVGIPKDNKYGLDALELLKQSPEDESLIDFVEDQLISLIKELEVEKDKNSDLRAEMKEIKAKSSDLTREFINLKQLIAELKKD